LARVPERMVPPMTHASASFYSGSCSSCGELEEESDGADRRMVVPAGRRPCLFNPTPPRPATYSYAAIRRGHVRERPVGPAVPRPPLDRAQKAEADGVNHCPPGDRQLPPAVQSPHPPRFRPFSPPVPRQPHTIALHHGDSPAGNRMCESRRANPSPFRESAAGRRGKVDGAEDAPLTGRGHQEADHPSSRSCPPRAGRARGRRPHLTRRLKMELPSLTRS